MSSKIWLRALGVGFAYYACALLSLHGTITEDGIAVVWLPNAVLLAGFLLHAPRQWPPVAMAAFGAEIAADVPNFPVWASISFGVVNLLEALLAACLIRRFVLGNSLFSRLRSGAIFLLSAPIVASASAALLGAGVYVLLGQTNSSYLALWRLWWFGDALGLLLLTPLIVFARQNLHIRAFETLSWLRGGELLSIWLLVLILGSAAVRPELSSTSTFYLTPIALVPLGIWAALRFGFLGAAITINLIAALAIMHLVLGHSPYPYATPQEAVWLTQEYLVVLAVTALGLAILMHETARLQMLATTDFLTSFANRRHFDDLGQRVLHRLARDGEAASVIVFDIDYFKSINDQHGHDFGDELLRRIQAPVKRSTRPRDLIARLGGDEFAILLPATDREQARNVAERLRAEIAELGIDGDGQATRPTASFGVAQWDGQSDLHELVGQADASLYRAKRAGRNRVDG